MRWGHWGSKVSVVISSRSAFPHFSLSRSGENLRPTCILDYRGLAFIFIGQKAKQKNNGSGSGDRYTWPLQVA